MTRKEKDIVREFILRLACAVGTHGDDDEYCRQNNKEEIDLFNQIARIVGGVKEM